MTIMEAPSNQNRPISVGIIGAGYGLTSLLPVLELLPDYKVICVATKHGIKAEQNFGVQGLSDLLTTTSLQVVLPIINQNSVVLIDQANPDIDAIKKQEKLEQIVLLD